MARMILQMPLIVIALRALLEDMCRNGERGSAETLNRVVQVCSYRETGNGQYTKQAMTDDEFS